MAVAIRRTRPPRFECSSRNSYGASGIWLQISKEKIFFFPGPTPSVSNPRFVIFMAGQAIANSGIVGAEKRAASIRRTGYRLDAARCTKFAGDQLVPRAQVSTSPSAHIGCSSAAVKEGNEQSGCCRRTPRLRDRDIRRPPWAACPRADRAIPAVCSGPAARAPTLQACARRSSLCPTIVIGVGSTAVSHRQQTPGRARVISAEALER